MITEERLAQLQDLQQRFSCNFKEISFLDNALTHRSFVNEKGGTGCCDNERLEFLGDAVLGLCVSDMLMLEFPDYTEGQLSKLRSSIVNEQTLAELARRFSLGDYLLLGKGEEMSGGRKKNSLLANTFEAVIAAIYLDRGFDKTLLAIRKLFSSIIKDGVKRIIYQDYKTVVQEIAQNRFRTTPRYVLIGEYGPDHEKIFEMELSLGSEISTIGTGKSKKEAEQQAAKKALEILEMEKLPTD